jgi:hypothetical protein
MRIIFVHSGKVLLPPEVLRGYDRESRLVEDPCENVRSCSNKDFGAIQFSPLAGVAFINKNKPR